MGKNSVNVPHRKGQSLMELAVSVVILLVLVAGLIDLGRAIFYFISMRDAAEEGMVFGVIYPTFCSQIEQAVRSNIDDNTVNVQVEYSASLGGNADTACSLANTNTACAGHTIEVIVTQPNFRMTMPFLGGWTFPLQTRINGTVVRPECH
jgi:Flp pilus assembly protein TadG